MSRVGTLFRLQALDLELDAGRIRLAEIEQALSSNPAVLAAQKALTAAETVHRAARAAAHDIELDAQALTTKIKEAEGRLYGGTIRNPKELKDLQAEIESLKRRLMEVEEKELAALMDLEAVEGALAQAQTQRQTAENAMLVLNGALASERETLTTHVSEMQAQREAATTPIAAADRTLYEQLRQTKKGRAVAKLDDDVCAACGIEPTAALRQIARRGDVAQCVGCGRILYAG
ncbi:MAG: hypothetical protein JNL09_09480 [Anaerolineales bacterium]|nr:hypothetical protein [Anaerolineales bacterium]